MRDDDPVAGDRRPSHADDADDEALMAWLSLPDVKARFAASRERAARGERIGREEALRELGITEEELAAEKARLDAEEQQSDDATGAGQGER